MDRAVAESTGPELIDLRIIYKWIKRRKLTVLLILLAGMGLTVWLSALSPTLYRASAAMWIERKSGVGPGLDLVNFAASAAFSRDTMQRTGDILGIKPGPNGRVALPGGFEKSIENQLLMLQVSAADGETAAKLANAWATATQEAVVARAQAIADQNRAGVEAQLTTVKQQLDEKQKALFEFERDTGINSADRFEAHPAALRLNELMRAFTTKQTEIAGARTAVQIREMEQLQKQLSDAEAVVKDLRAKTAQHKLLSSDAELARNAFEKLSLYRNELARGDRYDASVRIFEKAEAPQMPSKTPRWELNLLLGLVMSMVFALGGVIVAELLDDTIRTQSELKNKLGVSALAVIPDGAGSAGYDFAAKQPGSPAARGLHNLHIALEVNAGLGAPGSHTVLTVTAPKAGAGATFIAANLAALFAAEGRKVLLLDGDLRSGSATRGLNCAVTQGIVEALAAGKAGKEHLTRCGGFDLLGAGPAKPGGSLDPVRVAQLVNGVKGDYDIVIIDAPAVLGIADALAFASVSSAALLAARAGYTRHGELEQAIARLNEAKTPKVLTAINRVDDSEAQALGLA